MAKWLDWWRNLWKRSGQPKDEYVDIVTPEASSAKGAPNIPRRSWLTRWTPGAQRERQIAWLRAGYSEMLNLIRSIQSHLDRQEDVQQKLVQALEKLPTSLESLQSLGKAAEQQVEALQLLREQLARSGRHDQQLAESMSRFDQTLGLLNETARSSGKTVEDLVQQAREEDRLLHELVRRFEKRYLTISVFFVLALLALFSAALFFFHRFEREIRIRSSMAPPVQSAAEVPISPARSTEESPPESHPASEQMPQETIVETQVLSRKVPTPPAESETADTERREAAAEKTLASGDSLTAVPGASVSQPEKPTRRLLGRRKTKKSQGNSAPVVTPGETP